MNTQSKLKIIKYHDMEAKRIQGELNNLGSEFIENGIVRTILRNRVQDEKNKAKLLRGKNEHTIKA